MIDHDREHRRGNALPKVDARAGVAKSLQKRKKAIPEDRHFYFTTKWFIGSGGRDRTYDQLINSRNLGPNSA